MANLRIGNRQLMRELNTNLVLNILRRHGSICHAEISRSTQLSAATVTKILRELRKRNLLKEVGQGTSTGGRRPTMLRLNAEASYVISAAFFADEINSAILDLLGNIKKRTKIITDSEKGPKIVFKNFSREVLTMLKELGVKKKDILAVVISFEGIVDHKQGMLIFSSRFGWRNIPIKEIIEEELGLHTIVESEGRTMALGEYCFGIGRGTGNFISIDIDTGIGAAVILDGNIWRGQHSMEGEIGHTLAVPDGPYCKCGLRGCLETVASAEAIVLKTKNGLQQGKKTQINRDIYRLPTRAAIGYIFEAAFAGDEFALETIHEAGHYLSLAIAALVNYDDPEMVVLTGCVTHESRGMLLNIIREITPQHVVDGKSRTIRIEEGTLGADAVLIGGATLGYRNLFEVDLAHI